MANYKGGLLVFGGHNYISETEVFTPEVGFSAAAPMKIGGMRMNSLTIGTDRVVMFGGNLDGEGPSDKIFMYYNDEWSFAGNMVVANSATTAIMIGSSIIVSSGQVSGVIQQFEWDGRSISEGRIVDDVGDYMVLTNPIVIPELLEECKRPTNEFIFGATLEETGNYQSTAFELSLSTLDFSETTPAYFKDVFFDTNYGSKGAGIVNYKGQIYMIGGDTRSTSWRKVFKFTGSTTEEVPLSGDRFDGFVGHYGNNPVVGWQDNQERVFLCFTSYNSPSSCQTFDGGVIRDVEAETVHEHPSGCIGTFERHQEVVAIGGRNLAGEVEIFDGTSWRPGLAHPNKLSINAIPVDVGAGIITIGGYGEVDNGHSAYLLTYENMSENSKKWVDLGRLHNYYVYFSAFRFGEVIVAHRSYVGIYMLTWDGEKLEDHGKQIDLEHGGSTGFFIPKEDTK